MQWTSTPLTLVHGDRLLFVHLFVLFSRLYFYRPLARLCAIDKASVSELLVVCVVPFVSRARLSASSQSSLYVVTLCETWTGLAYISVDWHILFFPDQTQKYWLHGWPCDRAIHHFSRSDSEILSPRMTVWQSTHAFLKLRPLLGLHSCINVPLQENNWVFPNVAQNVA